MKQRSKLHQIAQVANRFLRTFCQSHGNDFTLKMTTWPRGQTWSLTGLTSFCYWGTDVAQGRSPTAEKSILERAVMGLVKSVERNDVQLVFIYISLWVFFFGRNVRICLNDWMVIFLGPTGIESIMLLSWGRMVGKCLINHDRSELERSRWFPFDEWVCDHSV